MIPVTRTPAQLAALASAAVPGLNPVAAGPFPVDQGAAIDAALVEDTEGRSWIVRASASAAAAVELNAGAAVARIVAKRLPVSVPVPRGSIGTADGGRALVHTAIPGRGLKLAAIEPDFAIATALGQLIATIHDQDPALFEDAGLESYTPDEYRQRRLTDLDRAASTGRVPANLLTRWEAALENVALWQFASATLHGGLEGRHVLVTLDDEGEATIRGVVGWRRAKVADPADDFAAIVREVAPPAVVAIARAYARARATRPDRHLLTRATLVAELGYVTDLFDALAAGYPQVVEDATDRLRQLADAVHDTELMPSGPPAGAPAAAPSDASPDATTAEVPVSPAQEGEPPAESPPDISPSPRP